MFQTDPHFWGHIIFIGKVAGAITGITALISGGILFCFKTFSKIKTMNDNVVLIVTTHVPALTANIAAVGKDVAEVRADIGKLDERANGIDCRLDDNKKSLDTFGAAFLSHLENGSDTRRAQAASVAADVVSSAAKHAATVVATAKDAADAIVATANSEEAGMAASASILRKKKTHRPVHVAA